MKKLLFNKAHYNFKSKHIVKNINILGTDYLRSKNSLIYLNYIFIRIVPQLMSRGLKNKIFNIFYTGLFMLKLEMRKKGYFVWKFSITAKINNSFFFLKLLNSKNKISVFSKHCLASKWQNKRDLLAKIGFVSLRFILLYIKMPSYRWAYFAINLHDLKIGWGNNKKYLKYFDQQFLSIDSKKHLNTINRRFFNIYSKKHLNKINKQFLEIYSKKYLNSVSRQLLKIYAKNCLGNIDKCFLLLHAGNHLSAMSRRFLHTYSKEHLNHMDNHFLNTYIKQIKKYLRDMKTYSTPKYAKKQYLISNNNVFLNIFENKNNFICGWLYFSFNLREFSFSKKNLTVFFNRLLKCKLYNNAINNISPIKVFNYFVYLCAQTPNIGRSQLIFNTRVSNLTNTGIIYFIKKDDKPESLSDKNSILFNKNLFDSSLNKIAVKKKSDYHDLRSPDKKKQKIIKKIRIICIKYYLDINILGMLDDIFNLFSNSLIQNYSYNFINSNYDIIEGKSIFKPKANPYILKESVKNNSTELFLKLFVEDLNKKFKYKTNINPSTLIKDELLLLFKKNHDFFQQSYVNDLHMSA